MKKSKATTIAILVLCVCVLFNTSTIVSRALVNDKNDNNCNSNAPNTYNYYRNCDKNTGTILEKYDTNINGSNDIDYYNLATSMSESKADRIDAMRFIISIYNKVDFDEQRILKSYIQSYAQYSNDIDLINFYNNINVTKRQKSVENYSSNAALNYAYQYWQNYNPIYPDLNDIGGDCANFVSQCLFAGGKQMDSDWYIYQKNNTYMRPANTTQLNESWDLANPSPWISAEEFGNYWSSQCTTYEYTLSNYESNHTTIYNSGNIKAGDALLLLEKVLWWYEGNHVMIIVGTDTQNNDFVYAGHSNNRIDGTILGNICESYSSNYKIKFFSM